MITQQLLDYIAKQSSAGVSEADIRTSLLNNGWPPADVDAALSGRTNSPEVTPMSAPTPLTKEEASAKIKEMGRFKASWLLFKQSVSLLWKDKEVILFPILSGVLSILVFIVLAVGLWMSGLFETLETEEVSSTTDLIIYGIIFVYYLVSYFILTFFRVGLTAVVYERINGGDIGFKEGMARATGIFGKILTWSLIAATVGVVLQVISDKSKWLGKLAASLLGAAWSIVTFFIAPTLLLDNVSVWQSIKNSGTVFKQTWGETIITAISMSLISTGTVIITIFVYVCIGAALASAGVGDVVLLVLVGLCFLTLLLIGIIFTSLREIFKVALYSYARFGVIAEGFSPEFIVGAVKEKGKK